MRPEDEPKLFAFLDELADATSAPRPHRVFLSPGVNACVFYDLSFFNLIVPSKKNLDLGLGLVNVLSLDELKAVVAHEFGHFAQKSMAVGRWVYVAQQIAGHIVAGRSAFDRVLQWISSIDLRVAWIGWLMRLFVWAIRAVLDTVLLVVVLAHRALGRNMEFQADRVAVSVSGSDSLIHALYRLGPGDEAYDDAVGFALDEARAGRPVSDLFAIQSAVLAHLKRIRHEPAFGETPVRPEESTTHRVFARDLASPPRMWATHPPNHEREEHAKAIYLRSALDARSAWELFVDEAKTRASVTEALFAVALKDAPAPAQKSAPAPIAESLARLEEKYATASLDPRYRGAYLGRHTAEYHPTPKTMIADERRSGREEALERVASLYPESLRETLAEHRQCLREERMLEGLEEGFLTAPGGVIQHRGEEIKRKDLAAVRERVRAERLRVERALLAHDAECRAAHLDAAIALGQGWDTYLGALIELLHYATHGMRRLKDAHGYFVHVLHIVLADGSVSSSERKRLVAAANDLHRELERAWLNHAKLVLPDLVKERFEKREGFTTLSQRLGSVLASESNIGEWIAAGESWAIGATGDLFVLAQVTLDVLLETESWVAAKLEAHEDPGAAPSPGTVPGGYETCVVGAERERQKKLSFWDRFQIADGFWPATARFTVASCLLLPALALGAGVGSSTIVAYNGLSMPVDVSIDRTTHRVEPYAKVEIEHRGRERLHVVAKTVEGRVLDDFRPEVEDFSTYVYNVARATPFVRYTVSYGRDEPPNEQTVGAPRWFSPGADYVLVDPPRTLRTRSGGETRTVLAAVNGPDVSPGAQRAYARTEEVDELSRAHLRFEPNGSKALSAWAKSLPYRSPLFAIVRDRALGAPDDVWLNLAAIEGLAPAERVAFCATIQARPGAPANAKALYLSNHCIADPDARDEAWLSAYRGDRDDALFADAAAPVLAARGEWTESLRAWKTAIDGLDDPEERESAGVEAVRTRRVAALAGVDLTGIPEIAATAGSELDFLLRVERAAASDDSPLVDLYREIARRAPRTGRRSEHGDASSGARARARGRLRRSFARSGTTRARARSRTRRPVDTRGARGTRDSRGRRREADLRRARGLVLAPTDPGARGRSPRSEGRGFTGTTRRGRRGQRRS